MSNTQDVELCVCPNCHREFDVDSSSIRHAHAVICPDCEHVSMVKHELKRK